MSVQGLRNLIGEGLVRHRARAAVGVESHRQGYRFPLRIKRQIYRNFNESAIGISVTTSVGFGVPAAEAVTCAVKAVHRQVPGGTVGEILRRHGSLTAVSDKGDRVDVGCPLRVKHHIRGDRNRLPVAVGIPIPIRIRVPAGEAVAFTGEAVGAE